MSCIKDKSCIVLKLHCIAMLYNFVVQKTPDSLCRTFRRGLFILVGLYSLQCVGRVCGVNIGTVFVTGL